MRMEKNEDIQSPCILVCSIEQHSGHCYGCGRSKEEIGQWREMSQRQREEIIRELPKRLEKLPRRKRRITRRNAKRKNRKIG